MIETQRLARGFRPPPKGRLAWLMVGRLAVATLLLGTTYAFVVARRGESGRFTPAVLIGLMAAMYVVTVVYLLGVRRGRRVEAWTLLLFATDLMITTGLVYVTGAATSVVSILYGVTVLMAAMILGPGAATITATVAIVLYAVLSAGVATGAIPHPPDQPLAQYIVALSQISFALMTNLVGLAVVAALGSTLAYRLRTTGGALRQAEHDLSSLARLNDDIVRSMTAGLATTDLAGHIRTLNPAGSRILATTTADAIGKLISRYLPLRRDGGDTQRGEGFARRDDGRELPVEFSMTPLIDAGGRITGRLITFQDLTEVQELRLAARRAEHLATLGRLATGLAHEVRNPLSSISGSVELVRDGPDLSDEDRHLLGIVIKEAERLNDLVSTMLEIGRPNEPMRVPGDLCAIATEVAAMARTGPAAELSVRIMCRVPDHPVVATIDADQVRQVFWNLVKNALQVSKAGGRVTIRVAEQDGAAMFEVLDEGPGVGDDADRLFEMFYTARKHGVGLGLALVKQIVERHDGRVIAVDREEGGACFRVILPNGVDVTRRTTSRPEGRALPSERNTQVPSQTRVTQSIPPPPLVTRSDDPTRER